MIQPTWYPEPLTPAELAAAAVATDVAGRVEADWDGLRDYADQAAAWDDRYLSREDRKALR